jgi:hypothetical protein
LEQVLKNLKGKCGATRMANEDVSLPKVESILKICKAIKHILKMSRVLYVPIRII